MGIFGKIRNLQEGEALGEKFIQVPKSYFKIFQKNQESVLLTKIYQDYIFNNIHNAQKNENNNSKKYCSYKCPLAIELLLKEHKPFNVIIDEEEICLVNINNTYICEILFKEFVEKCASMSFFKIRDNYLFGSS